LALIGQEALMPGSLSTLSNVFMNESMRAMRSRSILDMGFINLPVKSDFQ
jgi:hypothetical protein